MPIKPKEIPQTIIIIRQNLDNLWELQRKMNADLMGVVHSYQNIPAIRQKAFDDGIPGSNEGFNWSIVELQETARTVIEVSECIKALAEVLLSQNPEDWH